MSQQRAMRMDCVPANYTKPRSSVSQIAAHPFSFMIDKVCSYTIGISPPNADSGEMLP